MSSEAIQAEDAAPSYRPGSDQREVPPGHKRADMGVIPTDWTRSTIGEIATIYSGATPSTQVAHYWNGDIPWCVPTDITADDGKYLHSTERRLTQAGLDSCAAKLLPVGTLLLCSRATIGEVKIATTAVCTNQGFKALVCHDDVSHEFVYYLLLTLKPRMVERASGSTFLEIGKRDLASIPIALPGETEQRAIAEALSDMDELLGALEALIAKKRAIKQAAMQQLLTGKTRLPGFSGEWETKRLGEIASIRNQKVMPSQVAPTTPCVELEHIGQGNGRLTTNSTAAASTSSKYRFFAGDVLFGRLRPYLRKYWHAEFDGICTTEIWPLVADPTQADSGFLHGVVQTDRFIESASISYGTHMPRADWGVMRNFEIRVPSVEEQSAIATVLSDMDAEIAALEARRDKTRAIKQGMMQQLLTGRVRLVKPEAAANA